jgi:UDP-N-acetylglucosamine--N-acetylmuramyl-(pentapeptide) pyrophosphoryl-undecaprenol N-acetylglucosamine transferase
LSALLVAATGGHLAELVRLRPRLRDLNGGDVVWVTFDTPQSRSSLAGETVEFVGYTAPRDYARVARNSLEAARIMRRHRPRTVVSTGPGIALSFLPLGRARGLSCHFIESVARTMSPSVTGRLLRWVPGTRLYTQYSELAGGPWRYAGSVFDGFARAAHPDPGEVRRVVAMLGTIEGYGFRRLVERLLAILPADVDVLWQTGDTDVSGLPIEGRRALPERELRRAVEEADVVIAHAGAGSALMALESGRLPVLVPRLARHQEHVDDHQEQIAARLESRGLAVARSVDALAFEDLIAAAAVRVEGAPEPPPFELA